jgi:hypothetical protein
LSIRVRGKASESRIYLGRVASDGTPPVARLANDSCGRCSFPKRPDFRRTANFEYSFRTRSTTPPGKSTQFASSDLDPFGSDAASDPFGSDAVSGRRPDGPHRGRERLCPRNRRDGHPPAALPRCGRRLPRERADRVARNRGADRFSAPCRPACRSPCPGAAGAEVPIISVEVALAAMFVLRADRSPGCPWCVLVIAVAITAAAVIGLRRISERRRLGL